MSQSNNYFLMDDDVNDSKKSFRYTNTSVSELENRAALTLN